MLKVRFAVGLRACSENPLPAFRTGVERLLRAHSCLAAVQQQGCSEIACQPFYQMTAVSPNRTQGI